MPECPTCGTPYGVTPGKRGGRPREYCDYQPCREVKSLLNRLDTLIPGIAERAADSGSKVKLSMLRGSLFRLANLCNAVGRPVQGAYPIRNQKRSGWRGLEKKLEE